MLHADQGTRTRSDVGTLFVPGFYEQLCELAHKMLAKVKNGGRGIKIVERLGDVIEEGDDRGGKGQVEIETVV